MTLSPRIVLGQDFAGLFSTGDLAALLERLALSESLAPLAALHDGEVLRTHKLETFQDDKGCGIRVERVAFVHDDAVVAVGPLVHYPAAGERHLSVAFQPHLHSHGAYSVGGASGAFTAEPKGQAALPFVRLKWEHSTPTIDQDWWPRVARVGADPRSLAAAKALVAVLPGDTAEAVWLSHRLADMRWNDVIVPLLKYVPPAEPLPSSESLAEFVTALTRIVAAQFSLPDRLDGKPRLRFAHADSIQPGEARRTYRFPATLGLPANATVAVAVIPVRAVSKVVIRSGREEYTRPCNTAPSVLATIDPGKEFVIEIEHGSLRAAAFYEA